MAVFETRSGNNVHLFKVSTSKLSTVLAYFVGQFVSYSITLNFPSSLDLSLCCCAFELCSNLLPWCGLCWWYGQGRQFLIRYVHCNCAGVGTDSDPMHLSIGEGRDQVELVLDRVEDLAGKSNRSNSEEQRNPDPTNTEQSASLYNERERTELVEYAAQLEQEEKPKQEEMIENQGATSKQADALHQDDNDDYDDDGGEVEPEEHDTEKSDQGDASEGLHSDDSESRLDGSSHALEGDGNTRPGGAITKKDNESMIGLDLGETTSSSQEQQRRDNNIEQIDTQLAIVQKPLKSKKKCRHKTSRCFKFLIEIWLSFVQFC